MNTDKDRTDSLLAQVAAEFDDTIPNVYRTLARHPAALEAFVRIEHILDSRGHLEASERAVIALEVAVRNECPYCQGVFSHEARNCGVPAECVSRIIEGQSPGNPRLRALVETTRRVMATHGNLGRAERAVLEERGVSQEDLLEITTIIAGYTLATVANNLSDTRVDPEFR